VLPDAVRLLANFPIPSLELKLPGNGPCLALLFSTNLVGHALQFVPARFHSSFCRPSPWHASTYYRHQCLPCSAQNAQRRTSICSIRICSSCCSSFSRNWYWCSSSNACASTSSPAAATATAGTAVLLAAAATECSTAAAEGSAAAPTATESACPSAFYTFHAPAEAVCPCPFSHSRHPKASHPTWCAKCVWGEACLKLKRKQYLGWTAGACNPRVDCISKQRELLALLYVGSCLLCCI